MNKVYMLLRHFKLSGYRVLGIYTTKEQAEIYMDKWKKEYLFKVKGYAEFEVILDLSVEEVILNEEWNQ